MIEVLNVENPATIALSVPAQNGRPPLVVLARLVDGSPELSEVRSLPYASKEPRLLAAGRGTAREIGILLDSLDAAGPIDSIEKQVRRAADLDDVLHPEKRIAFAKLAGFPVDSSEVKS